MSTPRSVSPLRHEETQIGQRVRSVSQIALVSAVQGHYEILTGAPCPGSQQQIFLPHDHCKRGISLPRQTQYCFYAGDSDCFEWQNTLAPDWYKPNMEGGEYMSYDVSAGIRTHDTMANIHAYATPGIDTDNTAVSTNPCYFSAGLLLRTTYDCDLRFYNRTRMEAGTTKALTATPTNPPDEITMTCPITEGVVNEIDIEMLCTTNAGNTIRIYQMYLAETRNVSQPQTAGTQAYSSATRP